MTFLQIHEEWRNVEHNYPRLYTHDDESLWDSLLWKLSEFVHSHKQLGILACNDPNSEQAVSLIDYFGGNVAEIGQCIVLDCEDFHKVPVAEHFLTALEAWRHGKPFRINLPDILRHNPSASPQFINRAILWQRLGDRLIEEEDANRPTLLILKNLDAADDKIQHDLARLIRFHRTHLIRRTFLAVVQNVNIPLLEQEFRQLVEARFDLDNSSLF